MLKRIFTSPLNPDNSLLVVRIFTGLFAIQFGWQTFNEGHMEGNIAWLTDVHFPFPAFMAWLGKMTELFGGICLVLGLLTRLVTTGLMITMLVIIIFMGQGKIFTDASFPFAMLLLFLTFFLTGSGRWSLDYLLLARKKKRD